MPKHTLRPRTLLRTAAVWLALHSLIWLLVVRFEPTRYPWPRDVHSLFEHWDAWQYNNIIRAGYNGPISRWAFYPLYPLCVRALAWATGLSAHPEIVGVTFSTLLFAAFCLLQARLLRAPDASPFAALKPETLWGWFFFLCWPAAWVFHSHHTESLFLLLSLGAFLCARRGQWVWAAVLAGLCALTRNQGIFLAVAIALDSTLRQTNWRRRALVFCCSGLLSAALYAAWPLYQYHVTGDPFFALRAGGQFTPLVASWHEYFGTLWFANFWQHVTWPYYFHHLLFLLLNLSLPLLVRRREFALAFYVAASLWITLEQGHLENVYRYAAVLFPALYALGDAAGRLPRALRWALAVGLICLHVICTRNYALGLWAY
jgi:Gpi18-like mannosyltransferase